MPTDISGYGLRVNVVASKTFPAGINVTQFADDADPLDIPSINIKGKAMGLNGDLITWTIATPTDVSIAVIPGSDDDRNLAIILANNRAGKSKTPVNDLINVTGAFANGDTISLMNGAITDGPPAPSVASAGRRKSNVYKFTFENVSGTDGNA